jgi:uroporphyrinogen decarboxylase
LLQALSGQAVKTPPIWLMRQAGRYLPEYRAIRAEADGFLDLCFRPDLAVEVTLQPIRRFGFDAAILFSDILVVPHGLGQKVWFEEGAGPKLERLQGPEDLAALRLDGLEERLGKVYETVRGVRGELSEETALIGFAGAPWTVATYMVEGRGATAFEETKRWLYGDPDSFGQLISLLVEATTRHLLAQIRAGAEAVQIFDSWAGALSDDLLRRWSLAPLAEITARLREAHPEVPVVLFPRGAGVLYRDFARQAGATALGLDTGVPLDWARDELQPKVTVQGNLDPQLLVAGGEAMTARVGDILEALSGGPFIFNLGHGIVPETPPEHVGRLVELVRGWRS